MDTNNHLVPEGIRHDTPALYGLPLAERMKQHGKNLRAIAFNEGMPGVRGYKAHHPEAVSYRVDMNTLAYLPKPAGYDAFVIKLAENWLSGDISIETNKADVERLNTRFGGNRFNPANHFSKPLSPGRLAKLKALFLERGIHLDTDKANTLSRVKAAAVAARGHMSADQPFGSVGVISGTRLVIGSQSIAIMDHHGHKAVKLSVNGKRVWLRLDVLAAAFDLLSDGAVVGGNPSPIYSLWSIGEAVPDPEMPDLDTLAEPQIAGVVPASQLEAGEVVPDLLPPPTLSDRIAALRPAQPPHSSACAADVDPLTL